MSGVEGQLLPVDECSDDEMLIESFIHNQPNYFDGIVARQISNLLPSKPHKQERKRLNISISRFGYYGRCVCSLWNDSQYIAYS